MEENQGIIGVDSQREQARPLTLDIGSNVFVYFVVASAFFFSFIPLVYILNWIGISKDLAYAAFMPLVFLVILVSIYMGELQITMRSIFVLLLAMLFAVYAALSYQLTINYFDYSFTVFALGFLNPLYIFMATLIVDRKKHVLIALYLLSAVYFIFLLVLWLKGGLVANPQSGFIRVFDVVDDEYYQNINNYLGMMVVITLGMKLDKSLVFDITRVVVVLLAVYFMLKIGDRSSIVSLTIVLFFWFVVLRINIKSGYLLPAFLILILFGFSIFLNMEKLVIAMQESDIHAINRFSELFQPGDDSRREFLFSKAIEQFTYSFKNFMFGGGMNTFPVFTGEYDLGLYPHNIFLELLAEYGVVGFSLFMLPLVYILRLRKIEYGSYIGVTHEDRTIFMVFLYFFVIYMFTGNLRNSWSFIFIMFLLCPPVRKQQVG